MAIVQRNLYTATQNLTNLALNVDDQRRGAEALSMSTPGGIYTISGLIEVNGNTYLIEETDGAVFGIDAATDPYITITDAGGVVILGSALTPGIYDPYKKGFYQSDGATRTLPFAKVVNYARPFRVDLSHAYFSMSNEGFPQAISPAEVKLNYYTTASVLQPASDHDLCYNTTGNAAAPFKANTAGFYNITVSGEAGGAAAITTQIRIFTSLSGQTFTYLHPISSTKNGLTFTVSTYLQEGDIISVGCKLATGTSGTIGSVLKVYSI